jgi:Flp pilus assembly pilin Flp
VDRPRRPDQHALTSAQLAAAKQATATAEDAVREVAAFADDLSFRADEDERVQRFSPFISAGQYRLGSRKRRLPTGWSDYPPVRPCGRSAEAETAIPIDPSNARAIGPGENQSEGILFIMDRFNVWVGSLVARSHDIKKDEGQTFVEYALVLAVIVVGVLMAVSFTGLGAALTSAIGKVSAAISGP